MEDSQNIKPTGCCEPFNPEPWQDKEITWKDKVFVKDHVVQFFHIPLNFGQKVVKNMALIEIAKREAPEGKYFVMDVAESASLKEKFDGVFAQAFLLHFPKNEVGKIITLLKEKLKPGGYLYFAVKEKKSERMTRQPYPKKTTAISIKGSSVILQCRKWRSI